MRTLNGYQSSVLCLLATTPSEEYINKILNLLKNSDMENNNFVYRVGNLIVSRQIDNPTADETKAAEVFVKWAKTLKPYKKK